jgi:hypothetical protein
MDGRLHYQATLDNADYVNEFYYLHLSSGPGQAFCRGASLERDKDFVLSNMNAKGPIWLLKVIF